MKTINSTNPDDNPRSLKYADVLERRNAMLQEAHIAPLTRYVDQMRKRPDVEVPYFDPLDGGVNAKILFLLEKPGPMTAAKYSTEAKGSGFISRNNNDPTANATWDFMNNINLPRVQTVTWNVIPWWNGTMTVTSAELRDGAGCVRELVDLYLPKLEAIVLVGRKAQSAKPHLESLGVRIFCSAHPSPRVKASYPKQWHDIPVQWTKAKNYINRTNTVG